MDLMIYATERCNLACSYCEKVEDIKNQVQDISYSMETLLNFLKKTSDLSLHFYGGEPLLNIPFIGDVLKEVSCRHINIQTNGLILDKLDNSILEKTKVISISLDGPEKVNDRYRGKGVYKRAIMQAKKLRKKGYKGLVNVRMTTSPGVKIDEAVLHFIRDCEFMFDSIHWQLNVLFHDDDMWCTDKDKVRKWFKSSYNPGITRLVRLWADEIIKNNIVLQIIPFIGIMHSLLADSPVKNLRCGAGCDMWAITTAGDIYPCPVMRSYPEFRLGNISDNEPSDLKPAFSLREPCTSCNVFNLCGGRCLCANLKNEWNDEGYELVCGSVKHLINELKKVYPKIKNLVDRNLVSMKEFEAFQDYEVIP